MAWPFAYDVRNMLYEMHMHTPLCRHARGEPEEYAARAQARGLSGIVVTCHNPFPDRWEQGSRMYIEQWDEYLQMVERARAAWAGRVDVRLGLEADYFPGHEPWLEKQLSSAQFHHVLGSVHPQLGSMQQRFFDGDPVKYQRTYFDLLAQAAETGLFDTISHPDLVKNIHPDHWDVQRVMPDIQRALDRIARTGVAMELNTSGLEKAISEMNPGPQMLREMRLREIPVVIGSDAHVPHRVADRFEQAMDLLEAAGYTQISFFLDRQRRTVSIAEARASLIPDPAPAQ